MTTAQQPAPANPVLDRGLQALARFGYGTGRIAAVPAAASESAAHWSAQWADLAGDFAGVEAVPAYARLSPDQAAAARRYMTLRIEADALLDRCRAAHGEILAAGITTDRIESYAIVRDAYEDKVEAFGAARDALAALLTA